MAKVDKLENVDSVVEKKANKNQRKTGEKNSKSKYTYPPRTKKTKCYHCLQRHNQPIINEFY